MKTLRNLMNDKTLWTRMAAAVLVSACMVSLLSGCHKTESPTSSSSSSEAVSDSKYPKPAEQRLLCGSFVQYWYASGWGEGRWRAEMKNMVDNGMEYLIVPCAASRDEKTDTLSCYYPSEIEGMKSQNRLEILFKMCEEYGIKVFIAPYADGQWYGNEFGWSNHASTDDATGVWMKEYTAMSNRIATELYNLYAEKYPHAFYGWYYSDELWNMTPICKGTGKLRENALDIVASGFNGVLNHYTEISPGMPFIFSPFSNRSYSTAEEYKQMWVDLFAKVDFREGDIFCPQDSIGGHPKEMNVLAEWVRGYREAADTEPGLRFWMNNENFVGDNHATLDRFVQQLTITSAYCEANVTFSWQHHYSPYHENVNVGYEATYHDFYLNKKLETQAPTPPTATVAKGDDGRYVISFTGATDNIGICGFNIYRNKPTNLLVHALSSRRTTPDEYITDIPGTYYIEALDFAYNKSEMIEVVVPED